jgi:hypothetical protein
MRSGTLTWLRASPRRVGRFSLASPAPARPRQQSRQRGSRSGCIGCIGREPMKDLKKATSATSLSRSRPATSCGAVPVFRPFSHPVGRRRLLRYRGNGVSPRAHGSANTPFSDPQHATRLQGWASAPAGRDYFCYARGMWGGMDAWKANECAPWTSIQIERRTARHRRPSGSHH